MMVATFFSALIIFQENDPPLRHKTHALNDIEITIGIIPERTKRHTGRMKNTRDLEQKPIAYVDLI